MKLNRRTIMGAAAALVASVTMAGAQDAYPTRPITMIVPFAAGGSTDILARLVSAKISENLGQQIIVENRVGAGGSLASKEVIRAEPNGYTLIFQSPSNLLIFPLASNKESYDPVKDFTHIHEIARVPYFMAVHPSVEANTMGELAAYAKANPGKLNYGSSGSGTALQIANELFKQKNGGLDIVHVPYKGGAPALQDLMSGVVQVYVGGPAEVIPLYKEKKLKLIGVLSETRAEVAPEVPTSAEGGSPGVLFEAFNLISGPAGMPADVAARIADATEKAMNDPEIQAKLEALSITPVTNSTPETTTRMVESQVPLLKDVIITAKIVIE